MLELDTPLYKYKMLRRGSILLSSLYSRSSVTGKLRSVMSVNGRTKRYKAAVEHTWTCTAPQRLTALYTGHRHKMS
jgi:hypothetical protein